MHGYKWPINCTRTRTATSPETAAKLRELVEAVLPPAGTLAGATSVGSHAAAAITPQVRSCVRGVCDER